MEDCESRTHYHGNCRNGSYIGRQVCRAWMSELNNEKRWSLLYAKNFREHYDPLPKNFARYMTRTNRRGEIPKWGKKESYTSYQWRERFAKVCQRSWRKAFRDRILNTCLMCEKNVADDGEFCETCNHPYFDHNEGESETEGSICDCPRYNGEYDYEKYSVNVDFCDSCGRPMHNPECDWFGDLEDQLCGCRRGERNYYLD